MVKKTNKISKNLKKENNISDNTANNLSIAKKINLRHQIKIKKIHKKKLNPLQKEKIFKNFFEAQAAVKIECCICNENLYDTIKIILEPLSPKFKIHQKGLSFNVICLNCFISNIKFDPKNNIYYALNDYTLTYYKFKEYRIVPKMTQHIFTSDWSLGEEIKLIGAMEKLGFQNWDEISKVINKGKLECESHYNAFYYKDNSSSINENSVYGKSKSKDILYNNKDLENTLLFSLTQNIGYIPGSENNSSSGSASKQNNKKEDKNKIINQSIYEDLGYSPTRNEFDKEYNNDSELLLSELEFGENDSYEINNKKYKILLNYNNILADREERKKFISEKNLYNFKKQINFDKKLSNEDREIYTCLQNNLRFLTNEQFNYYYESCVLEKNVKALLNQLYMYRNMGCKTFEDIQKYINRAKNGNLEIQNEENMIIEEEKKEEENFSFIVEKNSEIKELIEKNKEKITQKKSDMINQV